MTCHIFERASNFDVPCLRAVSVLLGNPGGRTYEQKRDCLPFMIFRNIFGNIRMSSVQGKTLETLVIKARRAGKFITILSDVY